jgi:alpha-ribazole phosphatase
MRLLLIRHGETDWNAASRFQGQYNVPLNPRGRQQAAALAERLVGETIQALYASDLQRAWETAQPIAAGAGLAATREPRCREMSFGDWEGLTYGDIERRNPDALRAWQADPSRFPPPQGETLTQVVNRVREAYGDLLRRHAAHTVALVAHGGPLRLLLCLALGLPHRRHWQWRLDPGSLSELYVDDQGAVLMRLNDTHHLDAASHDG